MRTLTCRVCRGRDTHSTEGVRSKSVGGGWGWEAGASRAASKGSGTLPARGRAHLEQRIQERDCTQGLFAHGMAPWHRMWSASSKAHLHCSLQRRGPGAELG